MPHHWIQIKDTADSDSTILELIRTGHARRSQESLIGVWGPETWRLTADTEVNILSDEHLSIAGRLVSAELHRFSAHMYQSIIAKSPLFTQYAGLDELYRQIRQPQEGWSTRAFTQQLKETVRAGRQPDQQPRLVVVPENYTAQWKSDQIYLRKNKDGLWFMALSFDLHHIPGLRHPTPVPIALDLGLRPLSVACSGAGQFRTFQLSSLEHLRGVNRANLNVAEQNLLDRMSYASGYQDTQGIIGYLEYHGSRVYAEQLNLDGMQLGYVQTARATAISDYHFSYLPQSMYAAGIKFKRVPPYYTSQRCAHCYVEEGRTFYGNRQRHQLTCNHCQQTYNSHETASWNLWIDGEERYGLNQARNKK